MNGTLRCPKCSAGNESVVRGGVFLLRETRDILAPQKYRCTKCGCRWLFWPRLYRGTGLGSRVLRRLRLLVGGCNKWALPQTDADLGKVQPSRAPLDIRSP